MTHQNRTGAWAGVRWIRAAFKGLWTVYQFALGAVLVLLLVLGIATWQYFHVGDIRALRHKPPKTTAFIEAERAAHPERGIRWAWIPLSAVPRPLRRMALVAEDAKFYSHNGFDWESIEYAIVANRQSGRNVRGASTITQQVAKNLYLSGEKAMRRKVREAALTFLLEHTLEKDRILEIYLNVAQFAPGVFGVAEGARHHFGKDARELTQEEMLELVCLLPSPKRWNPQNPSRAYLSHKNRVARNYGMLRGIAPGVDSLDGDAAEALDSLDKLLSEERWGPLRSEPEWELREPDSGAEGGGGEEMAPADDGGEEAAEDTTGEFFPPAGGAGEGVLPE